MHQKKKAKYLTGIQTHNLECYIKPAVLPIVLLFISGTIGQDVRPEEHSVTQTPF